MLLRDESECSVSNELTQKRKRDDVDSSSWPITLESSKVKELERKAVACVGGDSPTSGEERDHYVKCE